jgi:CheY-like chemotaxis protein
LLERHADPTTKRVLHELAQPLSVIHEALDTGSVPPPSRGRQSSVVEVDAREMVGSVCAAARRRVPPSVTVQVYARELSLTVEPGRLGELLLLLIEGAANSLQRGRVVVGVSRRGSSALLRIFDYGTSRASSPQYLAVASAMAEALGLELELSSLGKVVAVTLKVPLGSQRANQRKRDQRPRVLLVDDDAGVRRALALVLDRSQFEVVALDPNDPAIFTTSFDLGILDYNLGRGQTAETLVRELRKHRGSEFPFIILTGENLSVETLERLGRARLVRKPAKVADLVLALRLMMEPEGGPRRANTTSQVRLVDRARELYDAVGGRVR